MFTGEAWPSRLRIRAHRCGQYLLYRGAVAPHEGRHLTHATANRKGSHFACALKKIDARYQDAKTIHLIMDNLNVHREKSVIAALGQAAGIRLWRRFTVHYTPKHASWLNPAEIEASLVSRECLGSNRVGDLKTLSDHVRMWNRRADHKRRKIQWKFKTADARRVFSYGQSTTKRSRH